ncbi:hypothetical protein AVEN_264980-1 [Araneus ventricosus]|uniref:Uncharacterized protein n=1 Tax=Araneus ventricosus TaxID=182803 RepID=A0A4Y2IEP9_ARAVE|nr:hypothetical protein AVEN_264980-1 [Araneus ventricosus]
MTCYPCCEEQNLWGHHLWYSFQNYEMLLKDTLAFVEMAPVALTSEEFGDSSVELIPLPPTAKLFYRDLAGPLRSTQSVVPGSFG